MLNPTVFAEPTLNGTVVMDTNDDAFPPVSRNNHYGRFTGPGEVRFTRRLAGSLDRVWRHLTDGDERAKWFAGGPMELRAGGRAELKFRHIEITPHETPPEKYRKLHNPGEVVSWVVARCVPPRLLVLGRPGATPAESCEITFELTPAGGHVWLELTDHQPGRNRAELAAAAAGWHIHLSVLVAQLSDNTPPLFWTPFPGLELTYANRLDATYRGEC